jgi:TM2 domain-containing membrane protein YozV
MANPILSAILSFIIPGLGQAINGNVAKGIVLFVAALIVVALATLIFRSWFVYIIDLIIALYAAFDAYNMAQ